MPVAFKETAVAVGGNPIQLLVGGSGEPLLILHGAGGSEGPLHYAQALAERYTVYLPSHPGFGASQRPDWLETIHDLAAFYNWFLESQDLYGCRAIGFSLGGWLAAEMVAAAGPVFRKLLLVGAVGLKPQQGEIADVFIISPQQVIDLLFHDPAQSPEYPQLFGQPPPPELAAVLERNREMAARVCWKPYMHDPRLPSLLARVNIPTRILWGREDKLAPVECGYLFQQAIPGSDLVIIDHCGHLPHIEKPQEFLQAALDFL